MCDRAAMVGRMCRQHIYAFLFNTYPILWYSRLTQQYIFSMGYMRPKWHRPFYENLLILPNCRFLFSAIFSTLPNSEHEMLWQKLLWLQIPHFNDNFLFFLRFELDRISGKTFCCLSIFNNPGFRTVTRVTN